MDDMNQQQQFPILPPALTIEALRANGYKDTDHALAELIDNSIDAEASLIELITVETPPGPEKQNTRAQITEIAVADNGDGMDAIPLRQALCFGMGTRQDRSKRKIGRFGVGLPNASISQCCRVDIWTWKNGADNALHCYLDLGEIAKGTVEVPEAIHDPVPDRWRPIASSTSEPSGTLIVWSSLDRVNWRGGRKTLERTAELCGRVYRNFIIRDKNPVRIILSIVKNSNNTLTQKEPPKECQPNDPLYLMAPSSTPEPFNSQPMFEEFNKHTWEIPFNNQTGQVHVRCSLVKENALVKEKSSFEWPGHHKDAGHTPWGKHAGRNQGVSIVRADRELELSHAWTNKYEPTERWWSIEVEFDPILDELFGVTNNKQYAYTFVNGAGFSLKEEADPGETIGMTRERLEESGDHRAYFIEIWRWIEDQITEMRKKREKMTIGKRTRPVEPITKKPSEEVATDEIKAQVRRGITGKTDNQPSLTSEEKEAKITRLLNKRRVIDSKLKARNAVKNKRRIIIDVCEFGHDYAFFDVESANDTIVVLLNQDHPVFPHLFDSLTAETDNVTPEELAARLQKASYTMEMLLFAWARHEDIVPINTSNQLRDTRMDWGREARDFLDISDDE